MTSYFITGGSSGIGFSLIQLLQNEKVFFPTRKELNLDNIDIASNYDVPFVDIAVHIAGHDLGGGVNFLEHKIEDFIKIINCNLLSTIILSKKLLLKNKNCVQVYITSTNLDKFYSNNLIYNLSKKSLHSFINLLKIDFPAANIKEARIGLTKSEFNNNRHKNNHKPINDLYNQAHMTSTYVANKILELIKSDQTFLRINEK